MIKCFHANNPRICKYYPRCAKGYIDTFDLSAGECLDFGYHGSCLIYIHSGEVQIDCNGFSLRNLTARDFIIIPDLGFSLTAISAVTVYIFTPEVVRFLADKLQLDYSRAGGITKSNWKPIPILDSPTAHKLSMGIFTDRLRCRHYVEYKFGEIVHFVDPKLHPALKKALASKSWFFRIRVADLVKSCRSLSEFARAMGLSDSGFSKAFRRNYGQSFYGWYQDRRFDAIVTDMIKLQISLRDLAVKHGFCSVQHLGFFIKKRTGVSAGKFRRGLLRKEI